MVTKKGFSLAEMLMVMLIISMFFTVAAKIVTTKAKPPKQDYAHGYFECYVDGASMKQRYVREGIETEPVNAAATGCRFEPPSSVAFFSIIAHNGELNYSNVQPNINVPIDIRLSPNHVILRSENQQIDLFEYYKSYMEANEEKEENGDIETEVEDVNNVQAIKNSLTTEENIMLQLGIMYPNSMFYNAGNLRAAVMISW